MASYQLILLAILASSVLPSSSSPVLNVKPRRAGRLFEDAHVFLTVSSVAGVDENDEFLNRMLEANWVNLSPGSSGSWVGIFDYDPASVTGGHSENALAKVADLAEGTGTSKTAIRFSELDFEGGVNAAADNCIGFWIAYFSEEGESPSFTNCLRLFPTWMEDLKGVIGDTPLTSVMIPGTHNAGSWKVYAGRPDDINLAIKYVINQEDPIYAQLMHGIRFFDVRIGYYPNTDEKYHINHDVTRIRPLLPFLEDVKRFVEETNEVVLIDLHRFPVGFGTEDADAVHTEFIQFLFDQIGSHLYLKSSGSNPTLNQVREAGKSILLSYNVGEYPPQYDFLWPFVYHAWGDVNKAEDLEVYLGEAMNEFGCTGEFWSAMAELTPSPTDIILKPNVGLRGFAELINLPVTAWFQNEAWYSKANIISTDYYLGNNIIEMAVEVNRNRAVCP